MESLLKDGFYYEVKTKIKKNMIYKDVNIFYWGLNIYHAVVNINIDADILFTNICKEYKKNFNV